MRRRIAFVFAVAVFAAVSPPASATQLRSRTGVVLHGPSGSWKLPVAPLLAVIAILTTISRSADGHAREATAWRLRLSERVPPSALQRLLQRRPLPERIQLRLQHGVHSVWLDLVSREQLLMNATRVSGNAARTARRDVLVI